MKRNWLRAIVALAVVVGFGFLANIDMAQSAPDTAEITDGKPKPKASKGKKFKMKPTANPCPAGWKKKAYESASMYTCVPKKPKKKKCPPKSEWFFDGCACGCKTIIY